MYDITFRAMDGKVLASFTSKSYLKNIQDSLRFLESLGIGPPTPEHRELYLKFMRLQELDLHEM